MEQNGQNGALPRGLRPEQLMDSLLCMHLLTFPLDEERKDEEARRTDKIMEERRIDLTDAFDAASVQSAYVKIKDGSLVFDAIIGHEPMLRRLTPEEATRPIELLCNGSLSFGDLRAAFRDDLRRMANSAIEYHNKESLATPPPGLEDGTVVGYVLTPTGAACADEVEPEGADEPEDEDRIRSFRR